MWRTRSEEKDQRAALIGLLFGRRGLQRMAEADALDHRFCCFPIVPHPPHRNATSACFSSGCLIHLFMAAGMYSPE